MHAERSRSAAALRRACEVYEVCGTHPFRKLFSLLKSFLNAAERDRSARETLRNAIVPQGVLGTPPPFNLRRLLLEPCLRNAAALRRAYEVYVIGFAERIRSASCFRFFKAF